MTEQKAGNGHHSTFEVGPRANINGEDVQLVYTLRENREVVDFDYRFHALQSALDVERSAFRGNDKQDPVDRVLDAAAKFEAYLRDDTPTHPAPARALTTEAGL